uniref:Uncharacterized protein n=1 Tax=Brassica campestris TaxID=3711 RepID=M4F3T0_BRACM
MLIPTGNSKESQASLSHTTPIQRFQERLMGPLEASMIKLEAVRTKYRSVTVNVTIRMMQSLLSHPKISFMLELEGITGKVVMLDEIMEYGQSLRRQVEVIQLGESLTQSLYATACSEQTLPSGYYSLAKNMPRFSDTQFPSSDGFVQDKVFGELWLRKLFN